MGDYVCGPSSDRDAEGVWLVELGCFLALGRSQGQSY